jgi:hypothetical protein
MKDKRKAVRISTKNPRQKDAGVPMLTANICEIKTASRKREPIRLLRDDKTSPTGPHRFPVVGAFACTGTLAGEFVAGGAGVAVILNPVGARRLGQAWER